MTGRAARRGVENDTRVVAQPTARGRQSRHVDPGSGAERGGRGNRSRTGTYAPPAMPAPAWRWAGSGHRLATTPGRLVLTSVSGRRSARCASGVVATGAEQSRERAVRAARTDTEPLLVHALTICTRRCRTPTRPSPPGCWAPEASSPRRRGFGTRTTSSVATSALTALTRGAETSAAQAALGTIADQLPDLHRVRRGGARQQPPGLSRRRRLHAPGGCRCSRPSMLPAAERVYAAEAERLNNDYQTGTDTRHAGSARRGDRGGPRAAAARAALRDADQPPSLQCRDADRDGGVGGRLGLGTRRRDQRAEFAGERAAQRVRLARGAVGRQRAALASAGRPQPHAGQPGNRRDRPARLQRPSTGFSPPARIAAALRSRFVAYRAAADRIQQLEVQGQLEHRDSTSCPPVASDLQAA